MLRHVFIIIVSFIICIQTSISRADDFIFIYDNSGKLVFKNKTEDIDSVAFVSQRLIRLYDKQKSILFSSTLSKIDSICIQTYGGDGVPYADLLDVEFRADGSAFDASPMRMPVQAMRNMYLSTYYNPQYGRYVAHFKSNLGKLPSGFYKVDYENNIDFRNALADGHSIEAIFMADYDDNQFPNTTCKFFTSHESGGTGFSIGSTARDISLGVNASNTSTNKYYWARSTVSPIAHKYYHVVGIWDKKNNICRIYVDGKLKASTPTSGEFFFPAEGSCWFGLGGDAGPGDASDGLKGDLVIARVYDKVLTSQEIDQLYKMSTNMGDKDATTKMITGHNYYSNLPVKIKSRFELKGIGYTATDSILISSIDNKTVYRCSIVPQANDSAYFIVPEGMSSNVYRLKLFRGDKTQDLGLATINIVDVMPKVPGIVAHRGYWDTPGSAQNSRFALRKAIAENLYGAETDVWITTDNHIMINHDASLNGVTIQTSPYSAVKGLTLSNGEKIPELSDFLDILAASANDTKIIIEIKSHSTTARTEECTDSVIALVKRYGLEKKVEFHSFSLAACKKVANLLPDVPNGYLGKDLAPSALVSSRINSMNYNNTTYEQHPAWLTQAAEYGIRINLYTPSEKSRMLDLILKGVHSIGTDDVPEAMELINYLKRHAND